MATTIKASDLVEYFRKALEEEWGYIFGASGQEWTEAKQKQIVNKMVNRYGGGWKNNSEAKDDDYYKSAVYGAKWVGHRVADCSGLFVSAFSQAGIRISHSSHYQYTDYCKEKGTLKNGKRSNGEEIQPGTAVFVYKDEKKRYTHIGLYVGDGIVIEAKGTEAGVVTSKVTDSKWNRWGMFKDADYTGADTAKPEDPEHKDPEKPEIAPKTLRRGDKGSEVKGLQTKLMTLGYPLPKYGADGDFGKETEAAVKAFQQDNGLAADGVVGKKTHEALENAKPMQLYTVTIPGLMKHEAEALVKNYSGASWREE